jgi:phage baseplate assembly protein gpV
MGTSPQSSSWIDIPSRLGNPVNAFKEAFRQLSYSIRVSMPGIVQSFDEDAQTVVVRLAIRELINVNTPDGLGNIVPVITPVEIGESGEWLADVPVLLYGGGGFTICPPISAGDECDVFFADRCINSWWANGGVQNQEVKRCHDLSDGFALVGMRSQPRKLSGYNTSALEIRSDDDQTRITMSDGNIVLTPDGGTTEITLAAGVVTLKAASIVIDGPITFDDAVTIDGALQVNSTINATGNMTAPDFVSGTIALTTHAHGGVANGSGVTGGPFG